MENVPGSGEPIWNGTRWRVHPQISVLWATVLYRFSENHGMLWRAEPISRGVGRQVDPGGMNRPI